MNITVIGIGYVGLVTGTCFSEMGNKVICVDKNQKIVEKLTKGKVSIYEPSLESLVKKNIKQKNLFFSTSIKESIIDADVIFIAVGTPKNIDGSANLDDVFNVSKIIGENLNDKKVIVNKSTAPVGTVDEITEIIKFELSKKKKNISFEVVSNPEFLKEGTAVNDFMKPDRVIIGSKSNYALKVLKKLYSPFFRTHERFIEMDIRSAEMTKYAANAMLATKISFINEIAIICEKIGADINKVRLGIGSDSRIGYDFIYPGVGFGGTCFPKDLNALQKISEDLGYKPLLLSSVFNVNNNQKEFFLNKIIKRFGKDLRNKTFSIWGLTFKPGTDDVREAPSIFLINKLISLGAKIKAYDPKVNKTKFLSKLKEPKKITIYKSKYSVLNNSNALILLTEWKEFRAPNFEEIKSALIKPIIFDGRNQYNSFNLNEIGFEYYQIGKK